MAPIPGKRKRRKESAEESGAIPASSEQLQAILKRHFEATFDPLPVEEEKVPSDLRLEDDEVDNEQDMGWEGLSDTEANAAEVINYTIPNPEDRAVSIKALKTFMSSKPPISSNEPNKDKHSRKAVETEDDDNEKGNMKNDLALQRLLKESHLLDHHGPLDHSGKARHKALDLRLQDMGSKSSIFTQQRMPLVQRKGINAKASQRDDSRRREAQENGIILEKEGRASKRTETKRDRGVGAPSVGRFHGGTLQLSKKDVFKIEGPKKKSRR